MHIQDFYPAGAEGTDLGSEADLVKFLLKVFCRSGYVCKSLLERMVLQHSSFLSL